MEPNDKPADEPDQGPNDAAAGKVNYRWPKSIQAR